MRNTVNLNNGWTFSKEKPADLTVKNTNGYEVSVPHTWNAIDGQDGGADYYRGQGWYTRELAPFEKAPQDRVYLEFEGVANMADVYVNGKKVGDHKGGYSTFRFDVTDELNFEPGAKNVIAVMADNSPVTDVYPMMADFTFYGGLYRDVNMITVSPAHFDLDFLGSQGLTVDSTIKGDDADLNIHAYFTGLEGKERVEFTVYDAEGQEVASCVRPATADTTATLEIKNVHRWNGVKDPYLYTVEARLVRDNEVLDEVSVDTGVREFHVDPQKGFFLNGELMPLRGVSRHQDRLGVGNALSPEDHLEDALLIRDLGANTIRLAHYQHDQKFYDLCDELGFIVWAEIPFISKFSENPAAREDTVSQMKELIAQNYNHPSIVTWGISNEITIGGETEPLNDNLRELNDLAHEMDKTRLTTMAQVSMLPMTSVQNQLTDILSYNHYFGWYGGKLEDNEEWLDKFHAEYPERALGISEYGCEGITTYHNDEPKMADYSEEYMSKYHEHMAKIIEERPWLWATHIWNMFDFGCDARDEGGVKGRNNKGLVTFDRKLKKDPFYLYKAYWSDEPFVHITSKRYAQRPTDTTEIKVYTNQPEVSLYEGDKLLATEKGDKVITFKDVKLHEGFNRFEVKAGELRDSIVIEKVDTPNEDYVLVENQEGGVTNWFDDKEPAEGEMSFDPAYYSIKDTINDLLDNPETEQILANMISSAMGKPMKASLLRMMGDNTMEQMSAQMAGMMTGNVPNAEEKNAQMVHILNQELQKIKK